MDYKIRKVDSYESTHNIRHQKGPNQKIPTILKINFWVDSRKSLQIIMIATLITVTKIL